MISSTIHQRIFQLMEAYGLNPNSLSVKLGTSDTVIRKILNGVNKPGFDTLQKIIQTFEGINVEWLLVGDGEMLLTDQVSSGKRVGDHLVTDEGVFIAEDQVAVYTSKIELLEDQVRRLSAQIEGYVRNEKLLHDQILELKKKHHGGSKDQDKTKPFRN